ncbi:hypothetical protein Cgig2_019247 [Carnegiea gigantea]|uniref:non-specific serine/threonine protein kinase n=1 Tax=Carnegiea gigantea TaxID=171969 RepID=A0A9Q1GUS4_9CARY|nr:hypothetical protein Cgig2_019247 [Carnegiea gigantea]
MSMSGLSRETSHILSIALLCMFCASACIASSDVEILSALRKSLMQRQDMIPNWFYSEIPPCNWTGVDCKGSEVHGLNLPCKSSPLELPFPGSIGELKNLRYLNLSQCRLRGVIPENLWSLEKLEILDLSSNRLSGSLSSMLSNLKVLRELVLDDNNFSGHLPSAIGLLKELVELSIRGNSFSGDLPTQLGNLSKLESLDLSVNSFSGVLPSSLANLSSLLYFDASNNGFTGPIFPGIGNLMGLRKVDLSGNSINGPIPADIGKLTSLTSIDFGDNNISGVIPSSVRNLRALQVLNVQNCRLGGTLPEELSNLANLTYLNLAHNSFEGGLPLGFGKLTNLVYLLAPNAGFSGSIPGQLGNCKKLRVLNLSYNSLSGPLPDGLAGMESIESVALDANRFSGQIPSWISNWTQVESIMMSQNLFTGSIPPLDMQYLRLLDLSSNMLSGELPSEICNVESLTVLLVSDNNFTGSIENTFRGCRNLTDLVLSGNNLSGELPTYLGDLPLTSLELSENRFYGKIPDQLWESTSLMEIYLSSNFLAGEIPAALAQVKTLERLQLDNNLLEGAIPASIGELRNLTNLSLHGNQLRGEIPLELFNCTKLVSLDLGSNSLTGQIPKSISRLRLLDNLVLSRNNLSGLIPEEICSGFQKVPLPDSEFTQHYGMLDLSYNNFVGPIPVSINRCFVVMELLLQNNKLNGSIPPEISGLSNLTLLNLSSNHLTGPAIPEFSTLRNLQGLILSHNELHGSIPDNMAWLMPRLTKLDISWNQLSGSLSPSVFGIESLTYLDISANLFSGSIPCHFATARSLVHLNASNNHFSGTLCESLANLTTLSFLDLHNNALTGTLPSSLSNLAALTYLDLSDNTFESYVPCSICSIEGLSFVNLSSNKFLGFVPETCTKHRPCIAPTQARTVTRAHVWGAMIGVLSILLVGFVCAVGHWILRHEAVLLHSKEDKLVTAVEDSDELLWKKSKEPLSINIATFEHSLTRLSPAEILSATDNFSKTYIIGDGGFGTVYKASLPDGRTIAVKRLNGGHFHGDREFLAEMETIGKVQHENLVPLFGYCVFAEERFLVYEYMENGSLDVWLRNRADAVEILDWPTRFKICLGSARGIAFLHHGFVPHIIHRDIKSSNILLDRNFEPKVSDFGLARIISAYESHVSTVLAGTFGYIPPEYGQSMVATTKGDIYSFGVVMLELVTGRAPTGQADIEGGNLVGWVRVMMASGRDDEVLDSYVPAVSGWRHQMLQFLSFSVLFISDTWEFCRLYMKDRSERWLILPFSLGCASQSSIAVHTPSHPKYAPPTSKQVSHTGSSSIFKKSKYAIRFSLPKPNISLGIRRLIKSFKSLSQIFAYKGEMEEETEMVIGYPTDVKHLTHIGWDGSTAITNHPVSGWENQTPPPEIISFPSISLNQFELAMAAQAQGNSHPQVRADSSYSKTAPSY